MFLTARYTMTRVASANNRTIVCAVSADLRVRRCPDLRVRRCTDLRVRRCPDLRVRRCPDLRVRWCTDLRVRRCPACRVCCHRDRCESAVC